ncbi:MAG: TrkH family potassium uptake protein [Bacillota bacterium]
MLAFRHRNFAWHPPTILAWGFAGMIVLGTLLLKLPIAVQPGLQISWLNALFTSTSAVCVTGLIVVDTAKTYSTFGQVVIMLLIQAGGLGLMTMSTLFALMIGKKITLRERLVIQEALNRNNVEGVVRLTKYILWLTLTVEGIATLILGARWAMEFGVARGFYLGLFHTVSAFNNAGFDLFSTSLIGYRGDIVINVVIMSLIIIGGLGFTVIADIYNKRGLRWLSLHSKVVLSITSFLLIGGMVAIYFFEAGNPQTMLPLPLGEKLLSAAFQSVTPRTAGFNTLPIGNLRPVTLLLITFLMFIGASPGGTGGGVKTTTAGAMIAVIYAMIRGRNDVEMFRRRLATSIIFKSLAIIFISMTLVFIATTILLATEKIPLQAALFEVTSAFGTVGLTTGITPTLSTIGRITIIATMFIGRVGPLTIAFALAQRLYKKSVYRLPEDKIMVG